MAKVSCQRETTKYRGIRRSGGLRPGQCLMPPVGNADKVTPQFSSAFFDARLLDHALLGRHRPLDLVALDLRDDCADVQTTEIHVAVTAWTGLNRLADRRLSAAEIRRGTIAACHISPIRARPYKRPPWCWPPDAASACAP